MRLAWQSALGYDFVKGYEFAVGFFYRGDKIVHVSLPDGRKTLCGDILIGYDIVDAMTAFAGASDIKDTMVRIRKAEGKHLCMKCWDVLSGIEIAMKGVKNEFRQAVCRNDREAKRERLVWVERRNDRGGRDRVCKEIPVAESEVDSCEAYRGSITITTIGGKE